MKKKILFVLLTCIMLFNFSTVYADTTKCEYGDDLTVEFDEGGTADINQKYYPIYAEPGDSFINNLKIAMQECLADSNLKSKFSPQKTLGSNWFFTQFKNIID